MKTPKVGQYVMILWHDPSQDAMTSGTPEAILENTHAERMITGGFFVGTKEMCETTYWCLGQDAFISPKKAEYRGNFQVPIDNVLWWTRWGRTGWTPPKSKLK